MVQLAEVGEAVTFQIDFEGRATRFVPGWDVESGRKKGIEDNTGASGLSSWRTELSVTEPGGCRPGTFGGTAGRAFWGDEVPGAHEVPSPPPTPSHPHSCFYRGSCTLTMSQPLGSDGAPYVGEKAEDIFPSPQSALLHLPALELIPETPRDPGQAAGLEARARGRQAAPADLSSSSPFSLPGGREQTQTCRRPAGLQAVPWGQAGLQDSGGPLHPSATSRPPVLRPGLPVHTSHCNSTLSAGSKPSPSLPKAWLRSHLLQEVPLDAPSLPSFPCDQPGFLTSSINRN